MQMMLLLLLKKYYTSNKEIEIEKIIQNPFDLLYQKDFAVKENNENSAVLLTYIHNYLS